MDENGKPELARHRSIREFAGAGDYDGSGTDDILWRNLSNGDVAMFAMDSNGEPIVGSNRVFKRRLERAGTDR